MQRPSLLVPWALASALLLGFSVFTVSGDRFLPFFITVGAWALLTAAVATVRRTRDLLHPLALILAAGGARFLIPWLEVRTGVAAGEPTLEAMRITTSGWDAGASVAVLGLLCLATPWWAATNGSSTSRLLRPVPVGLTAPIAGAGIGLIGIVLFFLTNAPASEVVSGGFRRVEVQEGTGMYFYLSLLLIPSSVMLTEALLRRGSGWTVGLAPVVIAGAAYFTLGGRARAVTPILAGLLVLWYHRRPRINPARMLPVGILCLFLLLWLGFFGDLYRGGGGLQAIDSAIRLEGFSEYVKGASLTDVGQLHGIAGSLRVGPAVLDGQTFVSALAWPVSALLGLPGRNVGVMVVEETMGLTNPGWGFHPSVIGEAFINFGPAGVVLVGIAFGLIGSVLYRKLQRGRLPLFVYGIAAIYLIRIFFESIQKWSEALVVLSVALLIEWVSQRHTAVPLNPTSAVAREHPPDMIAVGDNPN